MSHNERGLQNKADDNNRQKWESGDFPMVCEACLGDNPYLRMQKHEHDGNCKMCDRPYTVFKWRPGRGQGYRQTQVCQTCSKIKNLCQTCILDLQFGLPSQLRDAVLSQEDGTLAVPESEVQQEYFASQHMAMLANGTDPWQSGQTPNEKLLKIARNAVHDREQTKTKLAVIGQKRQASDISYANSSIENSSVSSSSNVNNLHADENVVLPPPGMTIDAVKALSLPPTPDLQTVVQAAGSTTAAVASKKSKPKPPPPRGPPPAWAFKNKIEAGQSSSTKTESVAQQNK